MRYGRSVEDGFLPVFSVGTEQEALDLIVMACPTNGRGEYIARELVMEQTLDNLELFAQRLDRMHDVIVRNGGCTCRGE